MSALKLRSSAVGHIRRVSRAVEGDPKLSVDQCAYYREGIVLALSKFKVANEELLKATLEEDEKNGHIDLEDQIRE